MARIRSIHPAIFTDEAWASVSIAARWLGQGLMTEADDNGVFEWKPLQMKMRLLPVDNVDVGGLLAELLSADRVRQFEAGGRTYGIIRNFCRYQRPRKPKTWFPLPPEYRSYAALGAGASEAEMSDGSELEAPEPPLVPPKSAPPPVERAAVPQKTAPAPQMEDGGEDGCVSHLSVSPRDEGLSEYPEDFDEFWSAYPVEAGMGKFETWTEWEMLSPDRKRMAVAAIPAFIAWTKKRPPDYTMLGAKQYLKTRRFEDFAEQAAKIKKLTKAQANRIYLKYGTPQFDAWDRHLRATRGKPSPRDAAGGWWFDTEYPPAEAAA